MPELGSPHHRLQWARECAGYRKPSDAARALGVPEPTYLGHENGSRGLSRAAQRYARFFRVSLDWLLNGRGAGPHHRRELHTQLAGLSSTERRKLVATFDPDAIDHGAQEPAVTRDGTHNVPEGEIPQVAARLGLGSAADAGTINIALGGGTVAALPVVATWRVPETILRRRLSASIESVHIVECEGDSMEPRIMDGDFVFIDTSRRIPSPPGIFALHDGFGQTLKRLEIVPNSNPARVKLIPENPRHETYERDLDEISIIGRYLCRLTMD